MRMVTRKIKIEDLEEILVDNGWSRDRIKAFKEANLESWFDSEINDLVGDKSYMDMSCMECGQEKSELIELGGLSAIERGLCFCRTCLLRAANIG